MDPLLLLTYTLLSSYFFPGSLVDAQSSFVIRDVLLSIEPSTDVTRGTNVMVRCRAVISSSSGLEALSREYTIIKDDINVYTKTSSTSEDLLYLLPDARVSNAGNFKCSVKIEGKQRESDAKRLTVTGLSEPVLRLNKYEVSEGDEVTATCTAPGENGLIYFLLYKDSREISQEKSNSTLYEKKIQFNEAGSHRIHCTYTIILIPKLVLSNKSNEVTVSVRELSVTPAMVVSPKSDIVEGDGVNISCSVASSSHRPEGITLYLSQGANLLSTGVSEVNHSLVALAKEPWDLECRLEMGGVTKVTNRTLSVTELFSVPTLTMSPAEVFQKEDITLICKSERSAPERLSRTELVYSLDPPGNSLTQTRAGVFSGKALPYDSSYTCVAQAKGIEKRSQGLTVRPKVSVSTPRISVDGRAVLGERFTVLCHSETGSLPINYTLLKDDAPVSTISISLPSQKALFFVSVTKPEDITKHRCEATNSHRDPVLSARLNTTVIVPLSQPSLSTRPKLSEMSEGNPILLTCSVEGTPPVTFKWFREDREEPLVTSTTEQLSLTYQVERLSKEHSGKYYCEAINPARAAVRSGVVDIEVHLAFWKKALMGGFCLLALLVLVVVCVLYFIFKRGKREAAASELSVKPSSPKSDDSLTVTLTHHTEVYNADTDAAPLYDGVEGRVTNGIRHSAASLPADISNRSSYSIPATV